MQVSLGFGGLRVVFAVLAAAVLGGCATQPPADLETASAPEPVAAEVAPPPVTEEDPTRGRCRSSSEPALKVDAQGLSLESVLIKTDVGNLRFRFYPLDAPCTVDRFRTLVRAGFYNGLTFHRVVPGFVIQGGDPNGDGTGGSGKRLAAELNGRPHIRGTVAMARAQDLNSADSQFYIALGTLPHLDGSYTVFGQLIEGLDVLFQVRGGDVMRSVVLETESAERRQ